MRKLRKFMPFSKKQAKDRLLNVRKKKQEVGNK